MTLRRQAETLCFQKYLDFASLYQSFPYNMIFGLRYSEKNIYVKYIVYSKKNLHVKYIVYSEKKKHFFTQTIYTQGEKELEVG